MLLDLQGHVPAARPGLLAAVGGGEWWRLALPASWAATAAAGEERGGGGPHGLLADLISVPQDGSGDYAEALHYLDTPWPWGWAEGEAEAELDLPGRLGREHRPRVHEHLFAVHCSHYCPDRRTV